MKLRYSLIVCATLIASSAHCNNTQVSGSLNDLTQALQVLEQVLSGGSAAGSGAAPSWEQDAQDLADGMTAIWKTIRMCQYSAADIKEYEELLDQYRQLITANNAETLYEEQIAGYAALLFEVEMNCLISQFKGIMTLDVVIDPQLINAYEMVHKKYIREIPAFRIDQLYKVWLDTVLDYVNQPAAGTGTEKPSRPLPSMPVQTTPTEQQTISNEEKQEVDTQLQAYLNDKVGYLAQDKKILAEVRDKVDSYINKVGAPGAQLAQFKAKLDDAVSK